MYSSGVARIVNCWGSSEARDSRFVAFYSHPSPKHTQFLSGKMRGSAGWEGVYLSPQDATLHVERLGTWTDGDMTWYGSCWVVEIRRGWKRSEYLACVGDLQIIGLPMKGNQVKAVAKRFGMTCRSRRRFRARICCTIRRCVLRFWNPRKSRSRMNMTSKNMNIR
jgi:hypothetical protein